MEYVIIGILVIIVILQIVIIFKKKDNSDMTERLGRFEVNINKELTDSNKSLAREITDDFEKLQEKIERRLNQINDKVNERLDQNFEKTNKTFTSVIERLSKIDEAQKKIESLSSDIVSLQSILTDKKTRGIYGEVNLKQVLVSVFGEKNTGIYDLQVTLPNKTIADSVLYAPDPLGTIVIDSKFPLENYRMMVDKKISNVERSMYEKQFKIDVKKHIDAISSKYIIDGVTSEQAIMFLPAEAIFAEINAYHSDIIDYSYKKKVWIASPTTLISTLTIVQMIIKNIERDKYTSVIHNELNKLGIEFNRYRERWDKLSKSVQAVNKDIENVHITTEKITKKFNMISQVEMDNLDEDENILKLDE